MAAVLQSDIEYSATSRDRMTFTIFLAFIFHAAIILGVTFQFVTKQPSAHTMEITLAQQRSKNKPDEPDFLAQIDQAGSGSLKEKQRLISPIDAAFQDTEIKHDSLLLPQQPPAPRREVKTSIITTDKASDRREYQEEYIKEKMPETIKLTQKKSLTTRAAEIASLKAKLDQQQQIFAKRPRIKRLASLSAASSADAYYLNSWRRKIENIGNLNYPSEARKRKLYGSLRLLVAIAPDGSLAKVELLESSGHKTLDDAAIRIVRLASPFAPFPDEMRSNTDILEVIRTWQFRKNSSLRSY